MKDYMKIYQERLSNPYFDEDTKAEPRATEGGGDEIKERLYTDLEFGTAGLRGIIGAGINRMNICVMRRATQGLASYVIKRSGADKDMIVTYDSRYILPEFAMKAAMTLATSGIKAYKLESLRPTPELFPMVRELGCITGINITTSHNPPEYNGYKVYQKDGAQFTPPHDKGVTEEVLAIEDLSMIKTADEAPTAAAGRYEITGGEIDDKCIAQVKAQIMNQKAIDEIQDQVSIAYTPLRGTGNIPARKTMKELGLIHVYVVPGQELPDEDFPTIDYPNSETAEAFALGFRLAREGDADLVSVTDPNTDRLDVYAKDVAPGGYIPLIGDISGSPLYEYVLSRKKTASKIPEDRQVIKPIVSTNLIDVVAREYGCELIEVLTGFKWIGQQASENEKADHKAYLFGIEKNYGCLIGAYARDKDAISMIAVLYEVAVYYKQRDTILWDAMVAVCEEYGYYKDAVKPIGLPSIEGLAKVQSIMETLRNSMPKGVGGCEAAPARDYKLDTIKNTAAGEVGPTSLPSSDVLYYDLNDGAQICVRPSGTEPRVKFHYGIRGSSMGDADARSEVLGTAVMAIMNKMM